MTHAHKKLILASQSPRRADLLNQAGFDYEILTQEISENLNENLSLDDALVDLARRKAWALRDSGKLPKSQEYLVLAADTVVVYNGQIFGKPKNISDACATLRLLSGKTHQVKTAICLWDLDSGRVSGAVCTTNVKFRELSQREIEEYVQTGEPMDKAGAYAVQGLAKKFVVELDGSLDNVIGLPVSLVEELLAKEKWNVNRSRSGTKVERR